MPGTYTARVAGQREYRKITVRHLGAKPLPTAKPISSKQIRRLREKANLSQAAFARYLNLSDGVHFAVGARDERAQRPGAGAAECDPAEGV